jgi:hypothetical protein
MMFLRLCFTQGRRQRIGFSFYIDAGNGKDRIEDAVAVILIPAAVHNYWRL